MFFEDLLSTNYQNGCNETWQLGWYSGPTPADFGSEVSDGGSGWGKSLETVRNDGKVSKIGSCEIAFDLAI